MEWQGSRVTTGSTGSGVGASLSKIMKKERNTHTHPFPPRHVDHLAARPICGMESPRRKLL